MIANLLHKICEIVFKAIFPTKCPVCSRFYQPPVFDNGRYSIDSGLNQGLSGISCPLPINHLLAPYLCPICIRGFRPVESPICICCGIPFKSREGEDHLCGDCIKFPKKFRMARASLVYDQTILNVVHSFKYNGKIQLAAPLGALLLAAFNRFWAEHSIDVIVPVPLHIKRFRKRGFNQVFLLIRNWEKFAAAFHINLDGVQIERNAIIRAASTAPQTGLGRKARLTNIKNAFKIQFKEKIKDKTILLVDDVYTTGATVNECARLLLKGGANQVDVLTLARAI